MRAAEKAVPARKEFICAECPRWPGPAAGTASEDRLPGAVSQILTADATRRLAIFEIIAAISGTRPQVPGISSFVTRSTTLNRSYDGPSQHELSRGLATQQDCTVSPTHIASRTYR